jgi:O-antigen/teichoic acid export membrane protein
MLSFLKKQNSLYADVLIYFAANLLNAGVPFALLPILTKYLKPEQYGEVALFQMVVSIFGAVTGLNVVGAANRKRFDFNVDERELSLFIGSCIQVLTISSFILLLVSMIFQNQISGLLGIKARWVSVAVAISAANFLINLRLGQWQVRNQAIKYGLFQFAQCLTNAAVSLLLIVGFNLASEGRILAQATTSIIFASIAVLTLYKEDLVIIFKWRVDYIKEALTYGIPLMPHVVGAFVLNTFDRLIIKNELGMGQTGVYMVSLQISLGLAMIFDAVNTAYYPWLCGRLNRDIPVEKLQIVRFTYAYFLFILMAGLAFFLLSDTILKLVAGEKYAKGAEVLGWLSVGQSFFGMYLMVTAYVFYSKKTSLLSVVTIISGIVNVALLIILVEKMKLKGAAIAYCLAMCFRFLGAWYIACKCHPMPWIKCLKQYKIVSK